MKKQTKRGLIRHRGEMWPRNSTNIDAIHRILFVPRRTRSQLLNYLSDLRKQTNCSNPVSLKNLDALTGPTFRCVRCRLHLGIAALIQNVKGQSYPIFTGDDAQTPGYELLHRVIGIRLVIFRIRDGFSPSRLGKNGPPLLCRIDPPDSRLIERDRG